MIAGVVAVWYTGVDVRVIMFMRMRITDVASTTSNQSSGYYFGADRRHAVVPKTGVICFMARGAQVRERLAALD